MNNQLYEFRKVSEKDYDFIYRVKKEAYQTYVEINFGSWDEEKQKEYFKSFINACKEDAYIITYEGHDIGFYNGCISGNKYEVGNICIVPGYQNRGIGTSILKDIISENQEKEITLQYFKQNPVGRLYERLGFEITGETEYHYQMMRGKNMLQLRDMRESDIEDYVRWFTTETEWGNWDSPWEGHFEGTEEEERKGWTEYYDSVKNLPDEVVRWKFEIDYDGKHIGWICAYTDLGYLDNPEEIWALGLDIPCIEGRKQGNGTKALKMYIDYLKEHGHKSFYTQTWSGNMPMIRVAEKLGFKEVCRKKDYREVRGNLYDAITWKLDLE